MSSGRLFLTYSFIPGSAASIMMCSVTSLGASSVARAGEKAIKAAKAAANTSAMLDMAASIPPWVRTDRYRDEIGP